MTNQEADELRWAAAANGITDPSDLATLEDYIAQGDEDAARGLIWAAIEAEGEGEDE